MTAEAVTCAHCATRLVVPVEIRDAARRYAVGVRDAWRAELHARREELANRRAARTNPATLRWVLVFSLLASFWFVAIASGLDALVPPAAAAGLVALTLLSFFRLAENIAGAGAGLDVPHLLASGVGACAGCGGPVRFPEGAPAVRCAYCGATGLSTPAMRLAMTRAAIDRVAPALDARSRAEVENVRTVTEAGAAFGVGGSTSAAAVGTFVILAGVGCIMAVVIYGLVAGASLPRHDARWVLPALLLGGSLTVWRATTTILRAYRERVAFVEAFGPSPDAAPEASPRRA